VGQTGSFLYSGISNHYGPNESGQANIGKRPVCPHVSQRRSHPLGTISLLELHHAPFAFHSPSYAIILGSVGVGA